jgi:hypothetical protein
MAQRFLFIPALLSSHFGKKSGIIVLLHVDDDAVLTDFPIIAFLIFLKVDEQRYTHTQLVQLRLIDRWESAVMDCSYQCILRQQCIEVVRLKGTDATT